MRLRIYTLTYLCLAIGLLFALCAVGGLTLFRPATVETATAHVSSPLVISRPGVLNLYAQEVSIDAEAKNSKGEEVPLVLAFGYSDDVQAWAQSEPYASIDSLSMPRIFHVSNHEAVSAQKSEEQTEGENSAQQADAQQENASQTGREVPIEDSDMWLDTTVGTGHLDAYYRLVEKENLSLLASSPQAEKIVLTFTWKVTPFLWAIPLALVAFLFFGFTFALYRYSHLHPQKEYVSIGRVSEKGAEKQKRQKTQVDQQTKQVKQIREHSRTPVKDRPYHPGRHADTGAQTSVMSPIGEGELSRRDQQKVTGRALGAAILPSASNPHKLRSRPLSRESRLIIEKNESSQSQRWKNMWESSKENATDDSHTHDDPQKHKDSSESAKGEE